MHVLLTHNEIIYRPISFLEQIFISKLNIHIFCAKEYGNTDNEGKSLDLHGKAKVLFGLRFGQEMPGADRPVLKLLKLHWETAVTYRSLYMTNNCCRFLFF